MLILPTIQRFGLMPNKQFGPATSEAGIINKKPTKKLNENCFTSFYPTNIDNRVISPILLLQDITGIHTAVF